MARIDSVSNPRVVAAARSLRRGERMPLEGERMLSEALDAGLAPEIVFYVAGDAGESVLARAEAAGASAVAVAPHVLAKLSDLPSVRGLVALAPPRPSPPPETVSGGVAVLLDGVQDPANVGAVIRCAEAFAAGGVLLTRGSASPFTARALRVSAGSAFRVPVTPGLSTDDALRWAGERSLPLVGADAHGGEPLAALPPLRPLVLVIGSEGHGISPPIAKALSRRVTIPLGGRVESLNAAVAAGILLYALSGSPNTSAVNR